MNQNFEKPERQNMSHIYLKCTQCGETDDIQCDGNNPMICPNCRSIDSFEEPEPELEPLAKTTEQLLAGILQTHLTVLTTPSARWVTFVFPGEISAEQAKALQTKQGYIVAGYGFYGFRHVIGDDKVILETRWQCSSNCE